MRQITPGQLAQLFRQLANAERGGLGMRDALAILSRDAELSRAEAAVLGELGARVSSGATLSAALEGRPETFNAETVALIRAAEAERALAAGLELVAADYEWQALQRAAVRGALAWPAIIVVVLFLLVALVMILVIPAFKDMFSSFGADLPAPTLFLMAIADCVAGYWWLGVALIALAAFGIRRGMKLPGGAWIDRALLRMPFVRQYLLRTFVSRVSRALGGAAESRLPLPPALAYLRATAGNRGLAESVAELEGQLRAGKPLSTAVRESTHLPGQLAVALELGERANNLGPALRQLVAFSESEAARSLMRLQQATLVGTYLCLAVVVAFVVIALYLPIFKMGAAI